MIIEICLSFFGLGAVMRRARQETKAVITPVDYNYCKTYFNIKMDKIEFSNTLKERIKFLKDKS